jgi:hypothetical protein
MKSIGIQILSSERLFFNEFVMLVRPKVDENLLQGISIEDVFEPSLIADT